MDRVEVDGGAFIIHVPGPSLIGQDAYDKALAEALKHAPQNAKVIVGELWAAV